MIFVTLDWVRSMPCSAARFDRCSAKLGIEISTVGSSDWISASWAADGTELPAPTQAMPTPNICAERAQIWPAGWMPMGNEMWHRSPGPIPIAGNERPQVTMPYSTSAKVRG